MQFQVLDALPIHPKPVIEIGVLFSGVARLNFPQSCLVEASENWTEWKAKYRALGATPTTPISFSAPEFGQFSMDFHFSAAAISRSKPGPR